MRLTIMLIWLLILCGSCSEKIFTGDVNCDECDPEKPKEAYLVIDLTINYKFPSVPLTIYYGDIENGNVFTTVVADYTPFAVFLPVDRTYSVRAEYNSGTEIVYAVNGTNLRVLSVTDACDEKCFVVENDKLDVRLRKGFP